MTALSPNSITLQVRLHSRPAAAVLLAAGGAMVVGTASVVIAQLNASSLLAMIEFAEVLWRSQHEYVAMDSVVAIVLFLAGFVSGLSGFAFSAVAACILWLLPPSQAMPLIMMLSLCNQLQLLWIPSLRKQIAWLGSKDRDGALPYIAGGLVGIPFGLTILRVVPAAMFACGLGVFLVLYSCYMLLKPDRLCVGMNSWKLCVVIGAAGGVVGGFSGFPGSMPVIYLGLRGVSKVATRGITLPYILTMQLAALGLLATTNIAIFNMRFWLLWAVTLPSVLLGSWAGVSLYRGLSDVNFHRAVLALLAVSGVGLIAKSLI